MKTPFIKLGRPVKYKNAQELECTVSDYFRHCKKHKLHPGICGLASWLGINRSTLLRYEKQEGVPGEYSEIISRARTEIEAYNEQCLYDNKKFSGARFILENSFDYDASQKVKNENINVEMSYEDYLKKVYGDSKDEY